MVLENIVAPTARACPAGYTLQPLFYFGVSGDANVCVKFVPASQATSFVSHVRLDLATATRSIPCRAHESAVVAEFAAAPVQVCFLKYNSLGHPDYVIGNLYAPAVGVDCTAGTRELLNFVGDGTQATRICAGYVPTTSKAAIFLESISTPGLGQACPVGEIKIGDMYNTLYPAQKYPLCAKYALASTVARPIVSFERSFRYGAGPTDPITPLPCRSGQLMQGQAPVFSPFQMGMPFVGLANLCLDQ